MSVASGMQWRAGSERERMSGEERERPGCDPKECELCLGRVTPGETQVEAWKDSDVQIDPETWA
jgi:hypothetical protein